MTMDRTFCKIMALVLTCIIIVSVWTILPIDGPDPTVEPMPLAGGSPVSDSEGDFNLSLDGDEFQVDESVVLTGEHNQTCNITFEVDYPNGSAMLYRAEETVEDGGVFRTEFEFTIPQDSPLGNYTVYATNDLDNSSLEAVFVVVPAPLPDLGVFSGDITVEGEPEVGRTTTITVPVRSLVNLSLEGYEILGDTGEEYSNPVPSPSGDRIAYRSDEDIYIMDADGTDRTALTSSGSASSPIWSNDGSRISYYELSGGYYHIWIADNDGSNKQQLTSGNTNNRNGWRRGFSDDDSKIVYTGENSTLRIVERTATDWSSVKDYQIAEGYRKVCFAESDTSLIAVTPGSSGSAIWHLVANGTWDEGYSAERLTETGNFYGSPDWIDFGLISYSTNRSGNVDDVWMQNMHDGMTLQVTNEVAWPGGVRGPTGSYSVDGSEFLCIRDTDDNGDTEIWEFNATATANVTMYDGDPDSGGSAIATEDVAVWGNLSSYIEFDWVPESSGNHSLHFVIEDVAPGDDNSTNDRAFVNVTVSEPSSNVTVSGSLPSSVSAGDRVTANVTIWNTVLVERNVSLILQLFEPDGTPIPPRFLANETIAADNSTSFQLSVRIPEEAISGSGDWQVLVCTGRPRYGGRTIVYDGGTIIIT